MKKKAILTVSILLLICIVATAFTGCFLFRKDTQEETLPKEKDSYSKMELLDVYQSLDDGSIHLIFQRGGAGVEYTLNDGEDWQSLEIGLNGDYYFNIDESDYGKQYDIAVRKPEDNLFKASEKSNTITYLVKAPSNIKGEYLNDFYSTLGKNEPIADSYKFVVDDSKVVLKRYCEDENGDIVLQPIAEDDRIDVEYMIVANEDLIDDEYIDMAKSAIEMFEIQEDLEDENELYDLAKTVAVFIKYGGIQDDGKDFSQWIDYDYDNGISNEEYAQSIVAGYDYNNDNNICRIGNLFFMLARVKGNDSTLMSKTFIIKCWI